MAKEKFTVEGPEAKIDGDLRYKAHCAGRQVCISDQAIRCAMEYSEHIQTSGDYSTSEGTFACSKDLSNCAVAVKRSRTSAEVLHEAIYPQTSDVLVSVDGKVPLLES